LGVIAGPSALATALRGYAPSSEVGIPLPLGCAGSGAAIAGLPRDTVPTLEAVATYAGVPAQVFVFGPVHRVGIAVAADGCRLLAEVDL
jgi:hypothetical protein